MREILFRGKRIDDGEWVYGGVVHQTDYYGEPVDRWFIIDGAETHDYDIGYATEVIRDTVGQYTGLKDRKGDMIFEGDIVLDYAWKSAGNTPDIVAIVCYNDGFWGLNDYLARNKFYPGIYSPGFMPEIIGNVHDNPNLLENQNV